PPPAAPELYSLSLHDALPICVELLLDRDGAVVEEVFVLAPGVDVDRGERSQGAGVPRDHPYGVPGQPPLPDVVAEPPCRDVVREDRKSTRLNSSHEWISYAVF